MASFGNSSSSTMSSFQELEELLPSLLEALVYWWRGPSLGGLHW